jgi:hypothetical protein
MTTHSAPSHRVSPPPARSVVLAVLGAARADHQGAEAPRVAGSAPDTHVIVIHRVGALVVAATIGIFGVVGLLGGLAFLDTHGRPVLGLSSNGLLSVVSLVTAAVLVVAAIRGGWWASTVMMVIGTLFLISALANLAVLDTRLNLLAFRLPNVFFSIGAGLVLLLLGAYGRVSGHLPDDNPYRPRTAPVRSDPPWRSPTVEDVAADRALAAAYRQVAAGSADPALRRTLRELELVRRQEDRRSRWIELQRAAVPPPDGPRPG